MSINRTVTSKSQYLGSKSNSKSGLKGLIQEKSLTKKFEFPDGSKVEAKRIVIAANEVETKTRKHPKNLRSSKGLTLDAVRDIYESIQKGGVNLEGIAVQCIDTEDYLLLDSSRRRFCCIQAQKSLPLWVLPSLNDYQIESLISDAQKSKKWSWREEGLEFIRIRDEKGLTTIDELAEFLGRGRETVRKRVQAGEISETLIQCFPDSEGIPSRFYPALAKVERQLIKNGDEIEFVIECLELRTLLIDSDVESRQNAILKALKDQANPTIAEKAIWEKTPLAKLSKGSIATMALSSDGRSAKFELTRINKSHIDAIKAFIEKTVAE